MCPDPPYEGAIEAMVGLKRRLRGAASSGGKDQRTEAAPPGVGYPASDGETGPPEPLGHGGSSVSSISTAMPTLSPANGHISLYDRMLEGQRAAAPVLPTTLAGRIRHRLGIAGLGEADMSLREVWSGGQKGISANQCVTQMLPFPAAGVAVTGVAPCRTLVQHPSMGC